MSLLRRYRATGADLPFGDPLPAHGVAMEGYFWRITDLARGRVLIALIGVNRGPDGHWATLGLASSDGFIAQAEQGSGWADPARVGASAGAAFVGTRDRLQVDLGADARLDVRVTGQVPWPRRRFGGSSWFQSVPALNQYWHPWLLDARVSGRASIGEEVWELDGAQLYAEKNWGPRGLPRLLVVGPGPRLRGGGRLRRLRRWRGERRTAAHRGHRARGASARRHRGATRQPGDLACRGRRDRRDLGVARAQP